MNREEWLRYYDEKIELLGFIGANSVPKAKAKLGRERSEFLKTKSQLQKVVNALETDNWSNAVLKAESLLNKIKKDGLPVWIRTISPYWPGKVSPSSYRRWLHFCQEQFLIGLGQLQSDVEVGLEADFEGQLEAMKSVYLSELPGEFIEAVSSYILLENEEED
jgi:hypothetical protein